MKDPQGGCENSLETNTKKPIALYFCVKIYALSSGDKVEIRFT